MAPREPEGDGDCGTRRLVRRSLGLRDRTNIAARGGAAAGRRLARPAGGAGGAGGRRERRPAGRGGGGAPGGGAETAAIPWASVTKLATALAALVAAAEGVVDLDDAAGPPGSTFRHL